MEPQVFLGGTVGNNNWREGFIAQLAARGVNPDLLFNPVVDKWTPEAMQREEEVKRSAPYQLYYLANPEQSGVVVNAFGMAMATLALYDDLHNSVVFHTKGLPEYAVSGINQTVSVLRHRFPTATILASDENTLLPNSFHVHQSLAEGQSINAYSTVEAVMALKDAPEHSIVIFDLAGFEGAALEQMQHCQELFLTHFPTGTVLPSLQDASDWIVQRVSSNLNSE